MLPTPFPLAQFHQIPSWIPPPATPPSPWTPSYLRQILLLSSLLARAATVEYQRTHFSLLRAHCYHNDLTHTSRQYRSIATDSRPHSHQPQANRHKTRRLRKVSVTSPRLFDTGSRDVRNYSCQRISLAVLPSFEHSPPLAAPSSRSLTSSDPIFSSPALSITRTVLHRIT